MTPAALELSLAAAEDLEKEREIKLEERVTNLVDAIPERLELRFGHAGARLVIEELLVGREASFFALCDGTRAVPLASFYEPDGIHRNQKRPDEIVTGVTLPREAAQWTASYQKLRLRDSFDFPELGIAAAVKWDGSRVAGFRLVANALETVPVVLDKLGADLVGTPLTDESIARVAKDAEAAVRPVKNTYLPPSYRKAMTRVFVERALRAVRR